MHSRRSVTAVTRPSIMTPGMNRQSFSRDANTVILKWAYTCTFEWLMYIVHVPVKNFIRIFIYLLVIWYNQELVIWIWLENVQRQFPTQILFGTITHELSRCMLYVGVQTLRSKCNILRNVTIVEQIDLFGNFFQFFFLSCASEFLNSCVLLFRFSPSQHEWWEWCCWL